MTNLLPLFVYGTLRPAINHGWVMEYALSSETAYLDNFALFDCGVPFVGFSPRSTVVGDLLWLNPVTYDEAMAEFDHIESYQPPRSISYIRAALGVRDTNYRMVSAWVYMGGPLKPYETARIIPSGDYVKDNQWH